MYKIHLMSVPAQLKYIILSILFVIASINFIRTTVSVVQSSKRLDELETDISALEKAKTGLAADIEYRKTDEFVEEKARNELNLIKPGEQVYVLPNGLNKPLPAKNSVLAANDFRGSLEEKLKFISKNEDANWLLWLELFL